MNIRLNVPTECYCDAKIADGMLVNVICDLGKDSYVILEESIGDYGFSVPNEWLEEI